MPVNSGFNEVPPFKSIGWGLTADLFDSTNSAQINAYGVSTTPITPNGFVGDGYSHRLDTPLPAWVSNTPISLQLTTTIPVTKTHSKEIIASILPTGDDGTKPFLQLVSKPIGSRFWGDTCVEWYDGTSLQSVPLGRGGWGWENTIQHSVGYYSKPQGVVFLDADHLLYSVHNDDTESIVYKYQLSTRSVVGQFTFGANYKHVGTFAKAANGDIWCTDYLTSTLIKVDVAASFTSGNAVILSTINASALSPLGCVAFVTVNSTEYLILSVYSSSSDSAGYLYLFPMSVLESSTIAIASRYKRWIIGVRVQGLETSGNTLYVARNAPYAQSVYGALESFDLGAMVNNLADGQTVSQNTNPTYFIKAYSAPTVYPEDLAIHPVTGELYTMTEGYTSVGDVLHIASIWKTNFQSGGFPQTYTFETTPTSITVKVNNNVWFTKATTMPQSANVLYVGGMAGTTAGFQNNYTWTSVKNLYLQEGAISQQTYQSVINGSLESSSITTHSITLVNPDAEAGTATGWTNEVGVLAAKNVANRHPPNGTWYFDGGSYVNTRARQRVQLSDFGLTDAVIDSGKCYARINWYQAQYNDYDGGTMGIRTLDASQATIATTYSGIAVTLGQVGTSGQIYWYPRTLLVSIPVGCRYLDAIYNAPDRTDGTNNDCYVDGIELLVYQKP